MEKKDEGGGAKGGATETILSFGEAYTTGAAGLSLIELPCDILQKVHLLQTRVCLACAACALLTASPHTAVELCRRHRGGTHGDCD